jgi:hypothetical protein
LNLEVRSLLGDDGELPIDLSVGPLALLVGNELRDQAPSDTPVDVEMRPLLPPIVTALDGDDRHLRIQLADLMLDLFLSPATGPRKQWATLAMVLTLDIGLSLDEEGKLKMDFDVDALAELEQEPLFELDNENVEIVMESLFKTLPTILGSQGLGGLFDLSSDDIFGISLAEIDVHSDGPNGDYISVEINLSSPE